MTISVGFLGAGNIATYHSKSLRASGADASWVAVHDPDGERAAHFGAATHATVFETPEEVVDRSEAVYVCTWTSEHEHLVTLAAEAGKAVFCEKPLGIDLAQAQRIVDTVERAGVVNQVGLVLRRAPIFHLLRDITLRPESGELLSFTFRDDQFLPVQGRYASTWRADVDKAGAGVLIEHSIHDIDLLEWMFGPIRAVSATARYVHRIEGIEDSIAVHLSFESGLHGVMLSVWHDLLDRISNRDVEVFGTTLWARLHGEWFGDLSWNHGDESHHLEGQALVTEAARVSPRAGENPDGAFVGAVASGRPAYPELRVALRAHEIVDACYRSVASGGAMVEI
ncbi:MAG: Gfo/Idh/MocA family oxidoreductase [Actinomycetia bacterium]|nr:Gfo/Idh/MocA family oxidoreductase [Actinomycetes bacterium]MCP4961502.1 Gfo/Idh/MocA family oxidoreductase [Actinomycetes bacterium]